MNNSITIIGRVGQEPKTTTFSESGTKLVKFSVGVKEYSPKEEEKTLWLDVEAWNGKAELVQSIVTKGREVAIQGRLVVSKFTTISEDGQTVQVTKPAIRLQSFHLCGKKPEVKAEQTSELAKKSNSKKKAS